MKGGGLDGYFGEQGLPVGIQECLERFHRGCDDYLSRQFVPKWDSPNCEGELQAARTALLLVELVDVAAQSFAGWMCEGGRHGMGCLNRMFKVWPDERFVQRENNIEAKGRKGSIQVKRHCTGFIGSTDNIIFSTEPGV